jgi:hypothetical protein
VANTLAYYDTATITVVKSVLVQAPEVGLLNKSLCLAAALDATKVITVIAMNSATLAVLLKLDLDVQQTGLCVLQVFLPKTVKLVKI